MLFLVISTPMAQKPSLARENQKQWWDWAKPLSSAGIAKHIYTKLGRGAVVTFEVDKHEDIHKLVNQWAELVPATFEVIALLEKDHQEKIARAGTNPMGL